MENLDPKAPVEGFLYTFGQNRLGGTYCRLIFCVLTGRHVAQYKNKGDEVPMRSGILDSELRLDDSGRQVVNGLTLYTLRLYSLGDSSKERLLGAASPEETAAWIKAFTLALEQPILPSQSVFNPFKEDPEVHSAEGESEFRSSDSLRDAISPSPPISPGGSVGKSKNFPRRPSLYRSTTIGSGMPHPQLKERKEIGTSAIVPYSDGVAASQWRLVRCENGLRFFEEITDEVIKYKFYKLPVMKCVGVVKADPSTIFDLVMHYGPERCQWDTTIDSAEIVETKDGHSDVVHIRLRQDWIWLRKRSLCLSRYWIREENGSYLVFYKSVDHPNCPTEPGQIRAIIRSGGYIISPLQSSESGKPRSLVEHVLEMDVAGWSSWFGIGLSPYPAFLRDSLLGCVAGIRDYFAAQRVSGNIKVVQWKVVEVEGEGFSPRPPGASQPTTSFLDTDDVDDEFFDAYDQSEMEPFLGPELHDVIVDGGSTLSRSEHQPDYLTGEWGGRPRPTAVDWSKFQGSLARGPLLKGRNCWSQPDGNGILVRGKTFLEDGVRVPAGEPICKLVAVDWFESDERIDHVARRPKNIIQRVAARHPEQPPYLFIVNMQVPGVQHHSLVFYFAAERDVREGSLLHRFIHGDDVFRNSRINMISAVPEGSWIVKQAAGSSRPIPVGQIMEVHYHKSDNYFEVDINMGSSSVVRGVMGLVFGYITALVVDMAFVIKGDTEEELPEELLGAVRCSHIAMDSAVEPPPAEAFSDSQHEPKWDPHPAPPTPARAKSS